MGDLSVSSLCPNLKSPSFALLEHFQPIDSNSVDNSVFSAYFDHRIQRVFVISIINVHDTQNIFCQLWYSGLGKPVLKIVSAKVVLFEGRFNNSASAGILCQNPKGTMPPYAVSIVRNNECAQYRNVLQVIGTLSILPARPSFSLCLSPLRNNFDRVTELLENVIVNYLFGTENIFVYNSSSTPRVRRILNALTYEKKVTVIQWHPRGLSNDEKSGEVFFDEMAFRHDCLMRSMGIYRHVAFSETYEFFVPRRDKKWLDIFLRYQFEKRPPRTLRFKNVYYFVGWPSDADTSTDKEVLSVKSTILLKTKRSVQISDVDSQTKYMVDPLQIIFLGLNDVKKFLKDDSMITIISIEDGLMHHYSHDSIMGHEGAIDRNMFRFRDEIVWKLQWFLTKYKRILL